MLRLRDQGEGPAPTGVNRQEAGLVRQDQISGPWTTASGAGFPTTFTVGPSMGPQGRGADDGSSGTESSLEKNSQCVCNNKFKKLRCLGLTLRGLS